MNKEQIQNAWDAELISAWDEKGWGKVSYVTTAFLKRVNPEIIKKDSNGNFINSFSCVVDYMINLNLNRCLDRNDKGELTFQSGGRDVIGFIHSHSLKMNMDLMDGIPKPIILLEIKKYKWKKINVCASKSFRLKQRREAKRDSGVVTIKARELKNRNWNTVK